MAGHEWDWFQREELIGQISDIRVQNLQVERENVQKRTFTRWMNLHLEKCKPPLEVTDLFVDIQDGKILMALLEVLTGQSLLHEYKSSTHRIFRLNNIAKALKFLEDSNVKLVSIDAAEIADGNPSLVLGLIWNIILFLQIKELTGNLNRMSSSSSLSSLPSGTDSDTSHPSTPSTDKGLSVSIKDQRKTIKALLNWVQQRTRKYGVAVQDFAGSWRSGLAFLAVIKAIDSSLVDMRRALEKPPRENLEDAFSIAQKRLSIPRLLEPEDVMVDSPDEHSIMTYVTQFLEHFPELNPDGFSDHTEETPLEMMYVHYKDGPTEEEGKIVTVNNHKDKDFSVEVKTRHLTLPETHEYTEVDIPYDKKPCPEESTRNPFQASMGIRQSSVQQTHGGFKLDSVSRKLDMSTTTSDTLDRACARKNHNNRNGEGDFLHRNLIAESELNSISGAPKEHNLQYGNMANHINNSSDLIMDKQPIDLLNVKDYWTDNETLKPSLLSSHHEPLPPKTKEEDEACKYVLHSPKDCDHRQMTVFKAYKASVEDEPDHKTHNLTSSIDNGIEEANATDSTLPSKISVIPHDLFYYPHYSVPIADVLQAFADACPDSGIKANAATNESSQSFTDSKGSLNGGTYMDTRTTGNGISVAKSKPTADLEGISQDMGHKEMLFPEYPEVSLSNGSIPQSTNGRQSNNLAVDPGYNKTLQEFGGVQRSEKDHKNKGTSRGGFIGGEAGSEDVDFLVIEGRAAKLAAETQQKNLKELSFSRDVQSDSQVYNRKKPNYSDHMNIVKSFEDEEKLSEHSRKPELGDAPPAETVASASRLSFWRSQLPDVFYITVLLWLLCYCILILPELDLKKVQLFAFNN